MSEQEATKTLWRDTAKVPSYGSLEHDLEVDVAIVGAGITGLTAALNLCKMGKKVAVLEAFRIGHGTSGGTSAHITSSYDTDFYELDELYDKKTSKLVYESLALAIDLIEKNAHEYAKDCDFKRVKAYYYTEDEADKNDLEKECQSAQDAGMPCHMSDAIPLPFATAGGLVIDRQAEFQPIKYLAALAKAITTLGGQIFEHSRVIDCHDASPCVLKTEKGTVKASKVVLATHTPMGFSVLHSMVEPIRSYIVTAKVQDKAPEGLFWDTSEPYYYIRSYEDGGERYVVIGGCDHKTGKGHEDQSLADLKAYVHSHFKVEKITHTWSAQFYEPVDHLPYIGLLATSNNMYAGTGYSGDGLTCGTLAGWMIAQQINGVETPYDDLYKTTRIHKAGIKKFAKHNIEASATFLKDHLPKLPNPKKIESLDPGDGCVAVENGTHVAAYRDEAGNLQKFSAVCPHMHCHVRWNAVQKSFDCPCHGSRFGCKGEVLEGPSFEQLRPL